MTHESKITGIGIIWIGVQILLSQMAVLPLKSWCFIQIFHVSYFYTPIQMVLKLFSLVGFVFCFFFSIGSQRCHWILSFSLSPSSLKFWTSYLLRQIAKINWKYIKKMVYLKIKNPVIRKNLSMVKLEDMKDREEFFFIFSNKNVKAIKRVWRTYKQV